MVGPHFLTKNTDHVTVQPFIPPVLGKPIIYVQELKSTFVYMKITLIHYPKTPSN